MFSDIAKYLKRKTLQIVTFEVDETAIEHIRTNLPCPAQLTSTNYATPGQHYSHLNQITPFAQILLELKKTGDPLLVIGGDHSWAYPIYESGPPHQTILRSDAHKDRWPIDFLCRGSYVQIAIQLGLISEDQVLDLMDHNDDSLLKMLREDNNLPKCYAIDVDCDGFLAEYNWPGLKFTQGMGGNITKNDITRAIQICSPEIVGFFEYQAKEDIGFDCLDYILSCGREMYLS
ncbi:hypothetical protein HN587_01550 [Candidatus Woesearchaeota archaeon]|jgi:hypothetical protein|nr:hypothetical protein [Candidatus Woesearchaeota archaeon]